MSWNINHLQFFDNQIKKKSTIGVFLATLIGPAFTNRNLALVFQFLSNLQKTLLYLTITYRYFAETDSFENSFFWWITWPIQYFTAHFIQIRKSVYTLFLFTVIIILLSVGLLVFSLRQTRKNKNSNSTFYQRIRIFGLISQGITFLLFHSVLLSVSEHYDEISQYLGLEINTFVYGFIPAVFLVLNFALALLFVLVDYEPLHFTHDVLAKRTTYYGIFSLLIKTLGIFFVIAKDNPILGSKMASCFAAPVEILSFLIFISKLPYYSLAPLLLENGFAFMNASLCILNFVLVFVYQDTSLLKIMVIVVLVLPLSAKASHNYLMKKINDILKQNLKNFKNEDSFFLNFLIMERIIKKGSILNKLIDENIPNLQTIHLMGFIREHSLTCKMQRCICKYYAPTVSSKPGQIPENFAPYKIKDQYELFNELIYLFQKELLEKAALMFPKWHFIKLNLANFLVTQKYENKIKALLLLYYVEEIGRSYGLKAKANQIKNQIEHALKAEEAEESRKLNNRLNMKLFTDSYSVYDQLEKLILTQTTHHLAFWNEIEMKEPKMLLLLKTSTKCEQGYQKIRKLWNKQSHRIDPHFTQAPLCYGLYLRMIKNVQDEAEVLLKRTIHLYQTIKSLESKYPGVHPLNVYNEENVVMRISLQNDKFGHIVSLSENIADHLGYQRHLLMNKNVYTIMPDFIKARHNEILRKYLTTGKAVMMNRTRKVYALHANGFIKSFYIYITPFPYIDADYTILAVLKPYKSDEDIILTSTEGDFEGITQRMAQNFGIQKENIPNSNITTFSPQFKQINRVFNFFAYFDYQAKEERIKVFEQSEQAFREIMSNKSTAFFKKFSEHIERVARKSADDETQRLLLEKQREEKKKKASASYRPKNTSIFKSSFRGPRFMNSNQESPQLPPKSSPGGQLKSEPDSPELKPLSLEPESPLSQIKPKNDKNDGENSSNQSHSEDAFVTKLFRSGVGSRDVLSYNANRSSFLGRSSILQSDTLKKRGSIFSKYIQLPNEFSAQAKAALQHEYEKIHEKLKNQGQLIKFVAYDLQTKEFREMVYLVNIHDEKVYYDTLRVIKLKPISRGDGAIAEALTPFTSEKESFSSTSDPASRARRFTNFTKPREDLGQTIQLFNLDNKTSAAPQNQDKKVTFLRTSQRSSIQDSFEEDKEKEDAKAKHQPYMVLNNLYKKACQLVTGVEEDKHGSSSVKTKGKGSRSEAKVERIINSNNFDRNLTLLSRIIISLFLITIIFLNWIAINTSQGVSQAWDIVQLLNLTYLRTSNLLDINTKILQFNMTQQNLINMYSEDEIISEISQLVSRALDLNNRMRQQIYSLQDKSQQELYQIQTHLITEISPLDTTQVPSYNSFQLTDAIIEQSFLLVQNSTTFDTNLVLTFLSQNIINGAIVLYQQLPGIEITSCLDVFTSTTVLNRIVLILGALLAFTVLIAVIRNEQNFLKKKTMALTAFLSISLHDSNTNKNNIHQFIKLVIHKDFERRASTTIKTVSTLSWAEYEAKRNHKRHKVGNFAGLYKRLILVIAQSLFILVPLIGMLIYLFTRSSHVEDIFSSQLQKVSSVYQTYFTIGLSFSALYQYVSSSSPLMLRKPIDSEITSLYTSLSRVNDVFTSLRGNDDQLDPDFDTFFEGNLCASFFDDSQECQLLGGQVLIRGLAYVQSYFADEITRVKSEYDISTKTDSEIQTILKFQGFTEADKIYFDYARASYQLLANVVIEKFHDESSSNKESLVITIIIFVIVIVLVLFTLWKVTERSMISDRLNVRRILRMVPASYVLSNKSLKAALARETQGKSGALKA